MNGNGSLVVVVVLVCYPVFVTLNKEAMEEVNTMAFDLSNDLGVFGALCLFFTNGYLNRKPLISDTFYIFPLAKGFLVS